MNYLLALAEIGLPAFLQTLKDLMDFLEEQKGWKKWAAKIIETGGDIVETAW